MGGACTGLRMGGFKGGDSGAAGHGGRGMGGLASGQGEPLLQAEQWCCPPAWLLVERGSLHQENQVCLCLL